MDDFSTSGYAPSQARARSEVSALLGQVMFLVSIALGFMTAGAVIGQDLSQGTALHPLPRRLRHAARAGVRRAPARRDVRDLLAVHDRAAARAGHRPDDRLLPRSRPGTVIIQAAGCTALITLGMGAWGFAMSKDLASWMRPLSFIILGLVVVSFVMLIFASGGNPILSAAIGIVSALLILVDFNYLRKHGTKDDAIWLATGIFVSIVNIFLSLLNIFGS